MILSTMLWLAPAGHSSGLFHWPMHYIATTAITDSFPKSLARQRFIAGMHAGLYGSTLMILNNTWYKDFPKNGWHTFNDSKEWLQMDKIGHGWSAYGLSRSSYSAWKWAGMKEKDAALWGSISGFTFLTIIEILDSRSAKWGWSWSDIAANTFGTGLFVAQQLSWNEQRAYLKFSFHRKSYGNPMLNERANELFGSSWTERMLKDYNGQTYWLSVNIRSFQKNKSLPPWLNLAVGYGADGLFGGFENTAKDDAGNMIFDARNIRRNRQFYFAPDIDFMRIPTRKKWLRPLFFILNGFKFPLPTIMVDQRGQWKGYLFYF